MQKEKKIHLFIKDTKTFTIKIISRYLYPRYYYVIDDVLQEVYYRAYKHLIKNKFLGQSKIETWLYTIAKNESMRMNNKLYREEIKASMFKEHHFPNDNIEATPFSNSLIAKEQKMAVEKTLNKLTQQYQNVMRLILKGYSEKEIAKLLNIALGTVKSRKHRAIKQINKFIDNDTLPSLP